jgi:RNA polymerase sigma factor (sigma-70 family)
MEAPGAYAHRIALNLAASTFRRRAAERRANARRQAEARPDWHDPDSATSITVHGALQQLRAEQRRVLVLRYFLGYSVTETADLLEMPVGSVKTHAHRGLSVLRGLLDIAVTAEDLAVPNA